MKIEFDPAKDQANIEKHGISLSRVSEFEILSFIEDDRKDYGQIRYRAWGLIGGQHFCLAFPHRQGHIRAISLRRAHREEIERYVPQT